MKKDPDDELHESLKWVDEINKKIWDGLDAIFNPDKRDIRKDFDIKNLEDYGPGERYDTGLAQKYA